MSLKRSESLQTLISRFIFSKIDVIWLMTVSTVLLYTVNVLSWFPFMLINKLRDFFFVILSPKYFVVALVLLEWIFYHIMVFRDGEIIANWTCSKSFSSIITTGRRSLSAGIISNWEAAVHFWTKVGSVPSGKRTLLTGWEANFFTIK